MYSTVLRNMERRKRREWEAEFVSEYVAATFPGRRAFFHQRLGTWPGPLTSEDLTDAERSMLQVRMRWADAVVPLEDRLIIIEGKLRASEFLKGLGELLVYTQLIPHTEQFRAWKGSPVVGRLLIPILDPTVKAVAAAQGFEVAIYRPSFWDQFLEAIQRRQSRPIRPEESELAGGAGGTPAPGGA